MFEHMVIGRHTPTGFDDFALAWRPSASGAAGGPRGRRGA